MKKNVVFAFFLMWSISLCAQTVILQMPISNSQNIPSNPIFTWNLLPTPSANVKHVFTIAEYNPSQGNQTTLDNYPLYSHVITSANSFQSYLYSGTTLANCTDYIWQVKTYTITYSEDEPPVPIYTYQAQSEIFQFRTGGCSEEEEEGSNADANTYIVPYKQLDHFVHIIHEDTLRIKYLERYNNTEIQYRIYTLKNDTLSQDELTVVPGLNYLSIALPDSTIEESPVIYTLELQGAKGDILKVKFEKKTL